MSMSVCIDDIGNTFVEQEVWRPDFKPVSYREYFVCMCLKHVQALPHVTPVVKSHLHTPVTRPHTPILLDPMYSTLCCVDGKGRLQKLSVQAWLAVCTLPGQ